MCLTIVGVVGAVRYQGPQQDARPNVYVPHAQMPRRFYTGRDMAMLVRASGGMESQVAAIRKVVERVDPGVPITRVTSMEDVVARENGRPRFAAGLMGLFGVVALLVGALGVYGVLSYVVQARANEIGIRMALGADTRSVKLLVLRQGLALTGTGIVIGTLAVLASGRWLSSMLYGVSPTDMPTLAFVIVVLSGASLLATWLPARRATRVDPLTALRA